MRRLSRSGAYFKVFEKSAALIWKRRLIGHLRYVYMYVHIVFIGYYFQELC